MVRIHRRTGLNDLDNHDGVVTHLEPDMLEYEVKWALRSITTNKTSGSDGVPAKLFKILKDDSVKVLHLVSQFSCSVGQIKELRLRSSIRYFNVRFGEQGKKSKL